MPIDRDQRIKQIRIAREIQKRKCEKSYYEFLKAAWPQLEQKVPFQDNWHIKYLCDRIQEEIERIAKRIPKEKDLIVNISPRSLKSYIFSIMLCPWAWTKFPSLKFINSSYSHQLSTDHCLKGRRLIQSTWYQMHWGHKFALTGDQNAKSFYENDKGGARFAASVKGAVTGHGADVLIGDDMLNPKLAKSPVSRQESNEHWTNTLFTRLNDQKIGVRAIVMQRLHEDDVTGHVLTDSPEEYEEICIPAEAAEGDVKPAALIEYYQDGLFYPERFSHAFLARAKKSLKIAYAGQFNQRPMAREGNIFKRDWFKFYDIGQSTNPDHHLLPDEFEKVVMSWDFTFKGSSSRASSGNGSSKSQENEVDFVVCQVWAKKGGNYYLLYQFRKQMGFVETLKTFINLTKAWPMATRKLIEDKANGPAIKDTLTSKISGIIPIEPRGSKTERAEAVAYLYEAGNVFYPRPERFSWVDECIDEHCDFPNAKHDDQVDAGSQALDDLSKGSNGLDELENFLRW